MQLELDKLTDTTIFTTIEAELVNQGFSILRKDTNRPWGGFFAIREEQIEAFIERYFPELSINDFDSSQKLSPKILIVGPEKRLSWQYHFRRSEIWRVAKGQVGVITSSTDEPGPLQTLHEGDMIRLYKGERHRLVGLDQFGIVAEIWKHEDPTSPSDEEDIVRVQDDFGR